MSNSLDSFNSHWLPLLNLKGRVIMPDLKKKCALKHSTFSQTATLIKKLSPTLWGRREK